MVDGRADIYSLGIMTFELLTGVPPFPEDDPSLLMESHLRENARSPQLGAGLAVRSLPIYPRSQPGKTRMTVFGPWKKSWSTCGSFPGTWAWPVRPDERTERKMMSLFLFYREDQRLGLNTLLEEFSGKLRETGINLKAADFKDIG